MDYLFIFLIGTSMGCLVGFIAAISILTNKDPRI